MDVNRLKNTILESNKIEAVLEDIGCHNIQFHHGTSDNYYTCANKDGDNPTAITVYICPSLKTINYTRVLNAKKEEHDLLDLIMFNKKITFFECLKYLCDMCGMDYYGMENDDDLPESVKLTRLILGLASSHSEDEYVEDTRITPKSEKILNYYFPYVNDLFLNDGISYETQLIFEVGYDPESNMITIPIRDELGNLVGVKGRHLDKTVMKNKYTYLIATPRGKILYNLFRSYESIQKASYVIVVESEKGCMQLFDIGYTNVVSLSGSKLTAVQRQKLVNLNVDIILALDKDISEEKLQIMADKFPIGVNVYAIIDKNNLLDEKESPCDNPVKWEKLFKNNIYKLSKGIGE